MSSLDFALPWTAQPQEVAQPSTSLGLTSLVMPGLSDTDLVSGIRLSSLVGAPTRVINQNGLGLSFNNTAQQAIFGAAPSSVLTPQASIVWAGVLNGTPADSFPTLGGTTYSSTNTNPFVGLAIKRSLLGGTERDVLFLTFNRGGSGLISQINSSNIYGAGPVVAVGAVQSGRQVFAIRSATGVEWLTATNTGTIAYVSGARIEIGDSLNNRRLNSACAIQGLANRAWSDAEINRVLDNYWAALFEPQQIYVPRAAAAPALPTLSAATAIDITATGFRPRVTYAY